MRNFADVVEIFIKWPVEYLRSIDGACQLTNGRAADTTSDVDRVANAKVQRRINRVNVTSSKIQDQGASADTTTQSSYGMTG